MSSPCSSRCETAMVRALDSSGAENRADDATSVVAVTGSGAAGTGSGAAGAVVFVAGVRAGVFFAGAVFLAVVALVLEAAAGRTFAGAVSGDGADEVAGMGAVTGGVGRGGAVAVKTSLDRAKKASAG